MAAPTNPAPRVDLPGIEPGYLGYFLRPPAKPTLAPLA